MKTLVSGHIEAGHRQVALQAKLEASARRIKVETANLRAGPGTDHEVIGKLPRDTPVIGLAKDGDWVEISIPGNTPARGWLHNNLLTSPPPMASVTCCTSSFIALVATTISSLVDACSLLAALS